MAVLARQHAGTARPAERIGHEAVGETYAFAGNTIDVRCLRITLVVGADGLERVVIAHDVDDIHRLLRLGSLLRCAAGGKRRQCSRPGKRAD